MFTRHTGLHLGKMSPSLNFALECAQLVNLWMMIRNTLFLTHMFRWSPSSWVLMRHLHSLGFTVTPDNVDMMKANWKSYGGGLIVWPQKYVSGVEQGQRECRMSPCVRLWCLMRKNMWGPSCDWHLRPDSAVGGAASRTADCYTGVRFNAAAYVVIGLVIVGGRQETGKRQPAWFIVFLFPILRHYWSLFFFFLEHSFRWVELWSATKGFFINTEWCRCRQLSGHCSVIEEYATALIIA